MITDTESAEVDIEERRGRRGDPEEVRSRRQQERVRKLASGDSGEWSGLENKQRSHHNGTAGRNGQEKFKRKKKRAFTQLVASCEDHLLNSAVVDGDSSWLCGSRHTGKARGGGER